MTVRLDFYSISAALLLVFSINQTFAEEQIDTRYENSLYRASKTLQIEANPKAISKLWQSIQSGNDSYFHTEEYKADKIPAWFAQYLLEKKKLGYNSLDGQNDLFDLALLKDHNMSGELVGIKLKDNPYGYDIKLSKPNRTLKIFGNHSTNFLGVVLPVFQEDTSFEIASLDPVPQLILFDGNPTPTSFLNKERFNDAGATIYVTSEPTDATVFFNDKEYYKKTNTACIRDAGIIHIRIERIGYHPWIRERSVPPGVTWNINAKLKKL